MIFKLINEEDLLKTSPSDEIMKYLRTVTQFRIINNQMIVPTNIILKSDAPNIQAFNQYLNYLQFIRINAILINLKQ